MTSPTDDDPDGTQDPNDPDDHHPTDTDGDHDPNDPDDHHPTDTDGDHVPRDTDDHQPIDAEPTPGTEAEEPLHPSTPAVPAFLDWILGSLIALIGFGASLLGLVALVGPDREAFIEAVEADEVEVEGMTEAEFVDFLLAMLTWIGIGLLLTGLAMIALGVAYIVHRQRVRERADAGEPTSDYLAHALLGAAVTVLTSFIPFSQVIGGGVAGYLERGDSERTISVGAASAVLMLAPVVVFSLFFAIGVAAGFAAIGDGAIGVLGAVAVIVSLAFSVAIGAALGALGGWIGGKLAERGARDEYSQTH